MADVLVVTSKVKGVAKKLGVRTSAEFIEALSKKVEGLIKAAVVSAAADKRVTLKPVDLQQP